MRDVVIHLEAAGKLLELGTALPDDAFFTDVIYRANHAFEGALKEAFEVLAEKESSGKTPHQIEQYLEKDGVLGDRVLTLLTNYRKEWRNPSTHDHRLFFKEQEAFLALVSVSAFVRILLDQIARKCWYEAEKTAFDAHAADVKRDADPADVLANLLLEFSQTHLPSLERGRNNEVETHGLLHAFLESRLQSSDLQSEPTIGGLRPDYALTVNGERAVLEIKLLRGGKIDMETNRMKVKAYMRAANVRLGALLAIPAFVGGDLFSEISTDSDGRLVIVSVRNPIQGDPS